MEKSFAIKLLKTAGPPSSAALERFRREAVALGRLRHPNIVEVTDSGIDGAEGGRPYIVTEFLEGRPLSDVCRSQGPLPLAQALPLLEQIATAVDAAHEAGVLHRDLKPGNVFVCSESPGSPSVKVLDLGLAKLLAGPDELSDGTSLVGGESPPGLTTAGSLVGTPLYTAPELLRHGKASRSSDIYSFGVLAYEILGGKPPFQGTLDEVLAGHLRTEPPPLPLPPEIWRPLRAALQKDPALRPGTAGEVVRRFREGMVEASTMATAAGGAGQRAREQDPGVWQSLLFVAKVLLAAALIYVVLVLSLRSIIGRGSVPLEEIQDVAENNDNRTGQPGEALKPAALLGSAGRPAGPPYSTSSMSPRFNDVEQACGDLSSLSNYLCLVSRDGERIAEGSRLVLGEDLASFSGSTTYPNDISIRVEERERLSYSFQFGAPRGKALIPGLYTGASSPYHEGSSPRINVTNDARSCGEGAFRILQILLTGDNKVRRFVADFETNCNEAIDPIIGRIAVGERTRSPRGTFGFNDIEQACGGLTSLQTYLCLVNRGSERIAGGSRLVLGEDLASFTSHTTFWNGIRIDVEEKKGNHNVHALDFYPPKGKSLIPGLYTEAMRFPTGPFPGIDGYFNSHGCDSEGGQFRILQIQLTGDNKLRRFVADFEKPCWSSIDRMIGRIAVGAGRIETHKHGEKLSLPVTQRPAEPSSSTAPMSPGVTLGFNDIEQACGDLSSLPNYLCLVNQGSEQTAGGARRVLDGDLASFTGRTTDLNGIGIVISIKGEFLYRFEFSPPKGKSLIPGLYTEAKVWPWEPYPGINLSVDSCRTGGQFRILQILLTGNKVRRFVADFESCGVIGRIAVGEE